MHEKRSKYTEKNPELLELFEKMKEKEKKVAEKEILEKERKSEKEEEAVKVKVKEMKNIFEKQDIDNNFHNNIKESTKKGRIQRNRRKKNIPGSNQKLISLFLERNSSGLTLPTSGKRKRILENESTKENMLQTPKKQVLGKGLVKLVDGDFGGAS